MWYFCSPSEPMLGYVKKSTRICEVYILRIAKAIAEGHILGYASNAVCLFSVQGSDLRTL